LWKWLQDDVIIYVCGDGKKMAPDVEKELLNIIAEQGAMAMPDARAYLDQLIRDKRYVTDVY